MDNNYEDLIRSWVSGLAFMALIDELIFFLFLKGD